MKKRIRLIPVLLTLCIICSALAGCDVVDSLRSTVSDQFRDDGGQYQTVRGMTFSYSPYYTPATSRYSYQQLNDGQKQLYDRILEGIYAISPERDPSLGVYQMKPVRVNALLTIAQMRIAIRALTNDNPYLFWLSQSFSHLTDVGNNTTEVVAYSEFAPETLAVLLQQLDAVTDSFFASVPSGLSAYQREKLVHDYIIDNCAYDREIAALTQVDEQNIKGHSIYGALVDRRCVCEGYGMTMQFLLNGLGVDCVTMTGMSYNSSLNSDSHESVLHLWNAVLLDDTWYHVDPTWDDQAEQIQHYVYFNLSDAIIQKDHTISALFDQVEDERIAENGTEDVNLYIPLCSSMDYNYYIYECPHLTRYDSAEVKEGLLQAAQNREPYYTFYVDPDELDYDKAVKKLFKDSPQYFFGYIEYVNDRLYDHEIDNNNLTYYLNKERSSISVQLKYY